MYLLEDSAFDDSKDMTAILQDSAIPNVPSRRQKRCSHGQRLAAKKIPKGTDSDTPIAEVLWQANKLAAKCLSETIMRSKHR